MDKSVLSSALDKTSLVWINDTTKIRNPGASIVRVPNVANVIDGNDLTHKNYWGILESKGCCSILRNHSRRYIMGLVPFRTQVSMKEADLWIKDISEMYGFSVEEYKKEDTPQIINTYSKYLPLALDWSMDDYTDLMSKFFVEFEKIIPELFEIFKEILLDFVDKFPKYLPYVVSNIDSMGHYSNDTGKYGPISKKKLIKSLTLINIKKISDIYSISAMLNVFLNILLLVNGRKHLNISEDSLKSTKRDIVGSLFGISYGVSNVSIFSTYGFHIIGKNSTLDTKIKEKYANFESDLIKGKNEVYRLFGCTDYILRDNMYSLSTRIQGRDYLFGYSPEKGYAIKEAIVDKLFNTFERIYEKINYKKPLKYSKDIRLFLVGKGESNNILIPHTLLRAMWENPDFVSNFLKLRKALPKVDRYFLINLSSSLWGKSSYGSIAANTESFRINTILTPKRLLLEKLAIISDIENNNGVVSFYTYVNEKVTDHRLYRSDIIQGNLTFEIEKLAVRIKKLLKDKK